MAHHHHATRRTVTPTWASRARTRAARAERTIERHWPFFAYALLTMAAGGYVVAQLVQI